MELWPVGGGDSIQLEPKAWDQAIGSGGFAQAMGCADFPGKVLKQLHQHVPGVDALQTMTRMATHAATMRARLTAILADDPPPLVRRVCRTLFATLTTHVGYHDDSIYLLQQKAEGRLLRRLIDDDGQPSWRDRMKIAKNLASAMVALRRCGVVHLDCSPDNVFVGPAPYFNVTLIDLDGCGVMAGVPGKPEDRWKIPPMTLGRADETYPIWFPIDPSWQQPLTGNFLFAERWVVINEVWRIFSWGGTAMFWLDETFNDLFGALDMVREAFSDATRKLDEFGRGEPRERLEESVSTVRQSHYNLRQRALSAEFEPSNFDLGVSRQQDIDFLNRFSRLTVLSFFHPKGRMFDGLGTERSEMPKAHWIQDRLIERLASI